MICLALAISAFALAIDAPDVGGFGPAQEAADVIREAAMTDAAWLAAGQVKTNFDKDNLATLLNYPTNEVVVLSLTGAQIKAALELSVQLFPQPNVSFLQLSGIEASFNRNGPPLSRITRVTVNGSKLEDSRNYTVAMPSSLARGGSGYYKVWDKAKIERKIEGKTIEDVLRGKKSTGASASRWTAVAGGSVSPSSGQ
jgi:2',3'-cyclic-nucleotide 2'-phosphodiesterase (5'-nucleotidase family)